MLACKQCLVVEALTAPCPKKNTSVHLTFFRKLPQSPSNTDLSLAWYVFLFIKKIGPGLSHGVKPWSCCVCRQHRKLASHIANLLNVAGIEKFLFGIQLFQYRREGCHSRGLPHEKTCRYKGGGHGWRTRNSTITVRKCVEKLCAYTDLFFYFFSPPVPKMDWPCGVQALNIDHSCKMIGCILPQTVIVLMTPRTWNRRHTSAKQKYDIGDPPSPMSMPAFPILALLIVRTKLLKK